MGTLEQKWGPNGDPKTEKGPHGDRVPQMGTHVATVHLGAVLTEDLNQFFCILWFTFAYFTSNFE